MYPAAAHVCVCVHVRCRRAALAALRPSYFAAVRVRKPSLHIVLHNGEGASIFATLIGGQAGLVPRNQVTSIPATRFASPRAQYNPVPLPLDIRTDEALCVY